MTNGQHLQQENWNFQTHRMTLELRNVIADCGKIRIIFRRSVDNRQRNVRNVVVQRLFQKATDVHLIILARHGVVPTANMCDLIPGQRITRMNVIFIAQEHASEMSVLDRGVASRECWLAPVVFEMEDMRLVKRTIPEGFFILSMSVGKRGEVLCVEISISITLRDLMKIKIL
jgi:hypothetical protein